MRRRSVRYVRRSIEAVNQAGVVGFAKETIQTGRPSTRPVPSTCAFVATSPQVGCGTFSAGICCERRQGAPGLSRSQRVRPMITAEAPRRMS